MGYSINAPSNFDPHTAFVYLFEQVIFFDDVLWEDADWHFHVFITVHGCAQVNVLNVKTHIFCIFCSQHTVPQYFGRGNVCCSRR